MKTHFRNLLLYGCLSLLLGFKTSYGQKTEDIDLASVKRMIEEKNQLYFTAIAKHDVTAFEGQYLTDSWIMAPNTPVYCGPGAAADYFNGVLLKSGIARGKFITIDLYGISADVVAEVGSYQFYNKSNEQFDDGKFIALWKKVDGQWKRHRQTLSSSRPGGI